MLQRLLHAGVITMLAATTLCSIAHAQTKKTERTFALWGHVKDNFTNAGIPDVKIELMNEDSVVIDSCVVRTDMSYNNRMLSNKDYYYRFIRPAHPARFIIRATHPDYDTTYVEYNVRHVKRNNYFDAPHHFMKRRKYHNSLDAMLDEVVVKPTRVKLVHKGDTLVYDATAFSLPEGSMLDALIRQLPGVQMDDKGVITVNGRQVDNLTLNGKDFFKGNNKVILDHLPYHTVKDIRVYDRQTDKSKYVGRDIEKQDYVMDINLKREYRKNYLAQAEAGVGTADKYRGIGFGGRITDNSMLMGILNINNVNGNNSERWNPESDVMGRKTIKEINGGVSFIDSKKRFQERFTVTGDITDNLNTQDSRTTHFNNTATNHSISDSQEDSQVRSISLRNDFQLNLPFFMKIVTNVSLNDKASDSRNRNAYLNNETHISDNVEALDSIFSSTAPPDLQRILVNRNSTENHNKQEVLEVTQKLLLNTKFPWGDNIELVANGTYSDTKSKRFNNYRLDYFSDGHTTDYRNRYYNSPTKQYSWDVKGEYFLNLLSGWTWSAYTLFRQGNNNNDERVYRLDWQEQTLSPKESVYTNKMTRTSESGLTLQYNKRTESFSRQVQFLLPVYVLNDKLNYARGEYSQNAKRTNVYVNGSVTSTFKWDNWRRTLWTNFWHTTEVTDVLDKITIPDDRNPLAIHLGNPELKNPHRYRATVQYNHTFTNKRWSAWGKVDGLFKTDPLVQAFSYDRKSGVYTYRNVNGDKFANGWFTGGVSGILDKNQRWNVEYEATLQRNIGQTAELGKSETESELYDFHLTNTTHNLGVRYSKGQFNSGVNGKLAFNRIKYDTSMRSGYDTRLLQIQHNLQYTVPVLELQLSSHLTWFHQRNSMTGMPSRKNLIWNVMASRSLLKNKSLMLKFVAFDILGDLKQQTFKVGDYSFTTGSQLRLDQYFMLSLEWKSLSILGKDKK